MTGFRTGTPAFLSWDRIRVELRVVLDHVQSLGVKWRGTRFDTYLRFVDEICSQPPAALEGKPGTPMMVEALRQADQLIQCTKIFPLVDQQILVEKLKTVFTGPDINLDPARDDAPRNALFELMVGRLMRELNFDIALTRSAEDLILSHARLPWRISVECKRPAYCTTPQEVGRRMIANLVALRRQLLTRDRRNVRMGVVAMDGLYRAVDRVHVGVDEDTIAARARGALAEAVEDINKVNRDRRLHLETGMHLGAVVLLSLGQDAQARGFTLRLTRLFSLGNNREVEKAISSVLELVRPA